MCYMQFFSMDFVVGNKIYVNLEISFSQSTVRKTK